MRLERIVKLWAWMQKSPARPAHAAQKVQGEQTEQAVSKFVPENMRYARKDAERTKQIAKKFVRYQEGAERYSLGLTKFQELAKDAKAVYKIDKVALVNCEIFEKYLETFRIA